MLLLLEVALFATVAGTEGVGTAVGVATVSLALFAEEADAGVSVPALAATGLPMQCKTL